MATKIHPFQQNLLRFPDFSGNFPVPMQQNIEEHCTDGMQSSRCTKDFPQCPGSSRCTPPRKGDYNAMNSFDEVFEHVKRYCLEKGQIPEVAVKLWIDALHPVDLSGTDAVFTNLPARKTSLCGISSWKRALKGQTTNTRSPRSLWVAPTNLPMLPVRQLRKNRARVTIRCSSTARPVWEKHT